MEYAQTIENIRYSLENKTVAEDVRDFINKTVGISTNNDFVDDEGNKLFEFDIIGDWNFSNEKSLTTHATGAGYSISCCMASNPKTIQVNGQFFDYCVKHSILSKIAKKSINSAATLTNIIGVDSSKVLDYVTTAYQYVSGLTSLAMTLSQSLYDMLSVTGVSDALNKIYGNSSKRTILKLQALERLIDTGIVFNLQPYGMQKKSYILTSLNYSVSPTQTEEVFNVSLSFQEFIKSNDNLYGATSRGTGTLSRQMEQQKKIAEAQSKGVEETTAHKVLARWSYGKASG